MFIGHWAPALLAAAVSDESPKLGTLFIGAQLVDWAFMLLLVGGVEQLRIVPDITVMNPMDLHHMPYSHSLLGTAAFALVFGLVIGWRMRNLVAATWAGVVVLSHWLLDLVVHRPDLTIAGGEDKLGWGLWNQPLIAMPLELAITIGAFVIYCRSTKGPTGPPAILLGVMLLFQAVNWFGPQPTDFSWWLVVEMAFAFTVITVLALWVGHTRWHKRQVGLAVPSVRR